MKVILPHLQGPLHPLILARGQELEPPLQVVQRTSILLYDTPQIRKCITNAMEEEQVQPRWIQGLDADLRKAMQ